MTRAPLAQFTLRNESLSSPECSGNLHLSHACVFSRDAKLTQHEPIALAVNRLLATVSIGGHTGPPRNLALALGIEVAELQVAELALDETVHQAMRNELADVFIYALLLATALNVEPIQAIQDKLSENAVKYLVNLARGRVTKYTRLRDK